MARLQKNDVLFAHIALHLAPDLPGNARRVGAAIIEHFNKRTGQCDPSIERIACMLGIDRATVMRATGQLCQAGLFERVTHGGRSHRTAYLPRWDRLCEIVDDWDLRMKDGSAPGKVAKLRRSRSQNCDVNSRKTATQTDRRNRQKEPKVAVSLSEATPAQSPAEQKPDRRNRLRKEGLAPARQRHMLLPVAGGRSAAKADAAEAGEQRRLAERINRLPAHEREAAWLAAMGAAR